jgi:8-oxo-dGTP pyrophosphatase MutT (NUDIX family)
MLPNITIYCGQERIICGNTIHIKDSISLIKSGFRQKDLYYIVDEVFVNQESIHLMLQDSDFSILEMFKSEFITIQAAGGLVKNELGEYLFIYRRDKWDLPKGKIEKGESRPDAATREVIEETGITNLDLGNYITTTFHIYKEKNEYIFKETFWYEMFSDKQVGIAQTEEDISEVAWIAPTDFQKVNNNTYQNIIDVLSIAGL